jgi:hypothetical protein
MWHMKKGMEIPPAVIVVVVILIVALIGFVGRKVLLPPQRVQMSPDAIKGMKAHMGAPPGGGAQTMVPGGGQHSSP